eukprot:TRINITY_DN64938_c0_g1_i1.p1 TRINITY_DN64938_c0_g1~~TRINITY_DN64938_c0_g1_i1.p1  ORF type:complete len:552 (-),score=49.03 TRINITY_DN64938_c0_g1_i1:184-1701(-)
MEQLCEFCEAAPAAIRCLNCTRLKLLCAECFAIKHKPDANKGHKSVPITELDSKATDTGMYLCPEHKQERHYICKVCEMTTCAHCHAIGAHKGHDGILFSDVDKNLHERFGEIIQEQQSLITLLKYFRNFSILKAKKLKSSLTQQKEYIKSAFACIKDIVNAREAKVLELVDKEHNSMLTSYCSVDTILNESEKNIKAAQYEVQRIIENAKTPYGYDQFAKTKAPDLKAAKERIVKVKDAIELADESVSTPVFMIEKIKDGISQCLIFKGPKAQEIIQRLKEEGIKNHKKIDECQEEDKFYLEDLEKIDSDIEAVRKQYQDEIKKMKNFGKEIKEFIKGVEATESKWFNGSSTFNTGDNGNYIISMNVPLPRAFKVELEIKTEGGFSVGITQKYFEGINECAINGRTTWPIGYERNLKWKEYGWYPGGGYKSDPTTQIIPYGTKKSIGRFSLIMDNERNLSGEIDGIPQGIMYSQVPKGKYYLTCGVHGVNLEVTIISFKNLEQL